MSGANPPTGAFADRLSAKPADATATPAAAPPPAQPKTTTDWADEVSSPTITPPSGPAAGQLDGATEARGGSKIQETEKSVSVTLNPESLAKMQADPNNPLYSADTFEKIIT